MELKFVIFFVPVFCLCGGTSLYQAGAGSNFIYSTLHLSLNGQWTVRNSNRSITAVANVPGGIYTDLMRNGVIGDPYFRDNDVVYKWIGRDNWTFSRRFQILDSLLAKRRLVLVCHGLDTVGNVYLNGQLLGTTDNMFVRFQFDISGIIRAGDNTITIAFTSAVEYARNKYNEQLIKYMIPPPCPPPTQMGECHINFIRKIQSSFSWDWGPSFPSQGIWKDIEIEAYDGAKLRDITVITDFQGAFVQQGWRLGVKAFFDLASVQSIKGQIRLALDGKYIWNNSTTLTPTGPFEGIVEFSVDIPSDLLIKEWWPVGYGDQPLYNVTLEYVDALSQETTTKTIRTGFRKVELIQRPIINATGLTFFVQVNGVPIFAKGSNWIPVDSFPERIEDSYVRYLLKSARDANMNMLRIWGGGMYETENLYEAADELGILLWQDLMFAVALYPVDDNFLNSVKTEVTQQIRRIQHHPSVFLWAANNENEAGIVQGWWPVVLRNEELYRGDYRKLYIETIRPIILSEDPSRPFLSSSPSNGKETEKENWIAVDPQDQRWGDVHFYNYTADAWDPKTYPVPRFASEYGFQSFPSFETLRNVSVSTDWTYPVSPFLDHRQHSGFGIGGAEMITSIRKHLFLPSYTGGVKSYQDLLYLSQIAQAVSIKTESEHYRRHRSSMLDSRGKTMGALYWQLNDIWQAPSWASIEFGGKWKILQYFAKKFFAPVLVSPFTVDGVLYVVVVSDELQPKPNLALTVQVYDWSSMNPLLNVIVSNITQIPQASLMVYSSQLTGANGLLKKANCAQTSDCFVYVRLTDYNGQELSNNFVFPVPFNQARGLQKSNIKATDVTQTSDNTFNVTLTSDCLAPFVWLNAIDVKGEFSDNGFLLVKPQTSVVFTARDSVTVDQLRNALTIRSLMDVEPDRNILVNTY